MRRRDEAVSDVPERNPSRRSRGAKEARHGGRGGSRRDSEENTSPTKESTNSSTRGELIGWLDLGSAGWLDLLIIGSAGASVVLMGSHDRGIHTHLPADPTGGGIQDVSWLNLLPKTSARLG
ncbi:hypothetical protein [Nocardia sp. NPDC049707]|uniref:hypothetical protein n=1 Tax=Nocardia sp. NPDC049707 TaxID=3154735 RepID=UPI00343A5FF2